MNKTFDPNFHIYLAFGQSNMEGQGTIEPQDLSVNPRFQVLWPCDGASSTLRQKGCWYDAVPPLAHDEARLGPGDSFGRTMVENLPEQIRVGILMVAIAGCDIQLFEKDRYQSCVDGAPDWMMRRIQAYGGNPYGRLVEMGKVAQKFGVIKGILLHQGETNCGQLDWPARVKGVYDNLVKDLNLDPNTPLVAGEVHPLGTCRSMNPIIRTLPELSPNFHVVSADGISGMLQDGLDAHYDGAAYRELGKRYAEVMLGIAGVP